MQYNDVLKLHTLYATVTTGALLQDNTDLLITSLLFSQAYHKKIPDYDRYLKART
jgi:methylglyoxal synthase